MGKIITPAEITAIRSELEHERKIVGVTGGCFDLLHIGHIELFEKSKEQCDVLFVLLESDQKIRELKGSHRPIHTQAERAKMLSAIAFVDYVVCLPYLSENTQYDQLLQQLRPHIITATHGDGAILHKQRQASLTGAKVVEVVQYIPQKSSSEVLKAVLEEK